MKSLQEKSWGLLLLVGVKAQGIKPQEKQQGGAGGLDKKEVQCEKRLLHH